MSGVAFLIEGADFSQNNLGKVNFSLPPEQQAENIVNNFESVIDEYGYHSQLYSMVLSLIQQGLWDKINHLYPVIGNTKEQFAINIKDVDNNKWYIGDNVDAIGNNVISFNQNDAGMIDFEAYKLPLHWRNLCSFSSVSPAKGALNTRQVHGCFRDATAVLKEGAGFAVMQQFIVQNEGSLRAQLSTSGVGSPLVTNTEVAILNGTRYNIISNLTEYGIASWVGDVKAEVDTPSSTTSPSIITHGMGSLSVNNTEPTTFNFNGEAYLFGHGQSLSDAEIIALNGIIDQFVSTKIL